jgi:hypothetical protein
MPVESQILEGVEMLSAGSRIIRSAPIDGCPLQRMGSIPLQKEKWGY